MVRSITTLQARGAALAGAAVLALPAVAWAAPAVDLVFDPGTCLTPAARADPTAWQTPAQVWLGRLFKAALPVLTDAPQLCLAADLEQDYARYYADPQAIVVEADWTVPALLAGIEDEGLRSALAGLGALLPRRGDSV